MGSSTHSNLMIGMLSASVLLTACADNSTQSATVAKASMTNTQAATTVDAQKTTTTVNAEAQKAVSKNGPTVLPTQKPDPGSYIGKAYSEKEVPVLKTARFVPVENFVDDTDQVVFSTGDCRTDAKDTYNCRLSFLMMNQESASAIRMPDGGSVVVNLSAYYDPWYSYTISYIKDGVLYPTSWVVNRIDSLRIDKSPRFARVNGDFCIYGEVFDQTKKLDTLYNCFEVNKSYNDKENSSSILRLSDQTYKHNVKSLNDQTARNTNLDDFNDYIVVNTEDYDYYNTEDFQDYKFIK